MLGEGEVDAAVDHAAANAALGKEERASERVEDDVEETRGDVETVGKGGCGEGDVFLGEGGPADDGYG